MASRYTNNLVLNIDPVYVENIVKEYLRVNEFEPALSKTGESYYISKRNHPIWGFVYSYQNGVFHVEAWLRKIGKEMDINDGKFYGTLAKIPYYNSILALLKILDQERVRHQMMNDQQQTIHNQPNMQSQQQPPIYNQPNMQLQQQSPIYNQPNMQFQQQSPIYNQPNMQLQQQSPIYNQPINNSNPQNYTGIQFESNNLDSEIKKKNDKNASIAFWLALASLLLMFLSKISLIVNLASFSLAINHGLKSSKRGLAVAAIVINSIAMALTLIRIIAMIF